MSVLQSQIGPLIISYFWNLYSKVIAIEFLAMTQHTNKQAVNDTNNSSSTNMGSSMLTIIENFHF